MRFLKQVAVLPALLAVSMIGQTPAASSQTSSNPFDIMTKAEIQAKSAELMKQAEASPNGIASVTLKKYGNHFTMLTVRTKSGGAEQHNHASDFFFVLDGEATEVTGGTIENSKETSPGELRGSRVVGGTEHPMRPGDVVHISPGTPHQTVVAPGKTFTYFVIKVEG